MKLDRKKMLAAKVLGVGKNSIIFDNTRLADIKEAITKQDIRDLFNDGLIMIREPRGKRTNEKRTTKRGVGKIKKHIKANKKEYVILVRKLRRYLKEIKKQGKLTDEKYFELRKKIKARAFKDKAHIKEHMGGKAE